MVHAIDRVDPTGEIVSKLTGPAPGSGSYVATFWLKVPLSSGNANAFAVALQNPFDIDLIVVRAVLDITTAGGTATSVLDVDVVDAATDTGDGIFDGADANAAAVSDSLNATDNGTNGEGKSWKWDKSGGTNDHVTAKILVANAASLAGNLYLQCLPTDWAAELPVRCLVCPRGARADVDEECRRAKPSCWSV